MRVAVLSGGRSSEHDVSLQSGASVADGLADAGHEVVAVRLERDGTWWCDGAEVALQAGRGLLGAECAFPVLHGPFGEDGTVQGLLELLDVPYVGSGVAASAVCMDKVTFKQLMASEGLAQVAFALVEPGDAAAAVGWPCWVKPARLGSSVGISKVAGPEEMAVALETAFAHDARVIVEAHAAGLEVECSVLGHVHAPETSVCGEITYEGDWYDYEAKYTPGGMELVVPARISAAAAAAVRALARKAFTAAGCSGLARADFFVDGDRVVLNELNTMPGFTQTSVYGKLWASSDMPYPELCDRLVRIAVERFAAERSLRY